MIAISFGSGLSRTQNALTVKTVLGKTKCLSTQSSLNAARYVAEVYIYTKDIHLYNCTIHSEWDIYRVDFREDAQQNIATSKSQWAIQCGSFGRSSFENQCNKLLIQKLTFKASNSIEICSAVLWFSGKSQVIQYLKKNPFFSRYFQIVRGW